MNGSEEEEEEEEEEEAGVGGGGEGCGSGGRWNAGLAHFRLDSCNERKFCD